MQINIDKKTGALLSIIAILAATLIFVISSKNSSVDHSDMSSHMHGVSESANFTGADVMFLQMMIPHHQQAIDMADVAAQISKNLELLKLASDIKSEQSAEIIQMRAWLKEAKASEDAGHSMHEMGGMLSSEDFANLKAATGSNFDKLWLEGMIGHHDGAIHMTNMIIDADNLELKKFGQGIVKSQAAQIEQMKEMLKRIQK